MQCGFSLAELVTAMVVITLLAMGIFTATTHTRKLQLQGKEKVQALSILEKEIHQLRQIGPRNLIAGTSQRATTAAQDGIEGQLTRQVIADPVQVQDKFIRLRLEWNSGSRVESLATFMFQE